MRLPARSGRLGSTRSVGEIPIQSVGAGVAVASIQVDLEPEILQVFQDEFLQFIEDQRSEVVIFDVSGVELMDIDDADALLRILKMASIMGARTMLVGLRPGVVSALVELGFEVGDVETFLTLDQALTVIEPEIEPEPPDDLGAETEEEEPSADGVS